MSFVNTSMLAGSTGTEPAPYQPPAGNTYAAWNARAPSDAIALAPQFGEPPVGGGFGSGSYGGLYGGSSSGSTGLAGFAGIMNAFMNMLSNALGSLGGLFGGGSPIGNPPQAQTYFSNATASSMGDPHDAFDGTTGAGTAVNAKWDSMQCHPDLLNSNSFAGGYRVSTTTTAPQQNGVTYNASATVATDGGATDVTLNANGSFAVTENGATISLARGQTTSLGQNESVMLGTDGSLHITDTNAYGGSIVTTLSSNGTGVDVSASATDVNLGGYLVGRTDDGPQTSPQSAPQYGSFPAFGNGTVASPFGTFTNQLGASSSSFGDVQALLQGAAEF